MKEKKVHLKSGGLTAYGFACGYAQFSPKRNLIIYELTKGIYCVETYGKFTISRGFTSLEDARKFFKLKCSEE